MNEKNQESRQKSVSISFPPELLAEIDVMAKAERRSRSQWIVMTLEKRLVEEPTAPYIAVKSPAAASPQKDTGAGAA
jgi:hypothetical protein